MVLSRLVVVASVVAGSGVMVSAPRGASAQPLPGPNQFVSGLDLECYDTPGPALNIGLTLRHLNPVLINLGLQPHQVVIRELQQTCVPVQKNGVPPQAAALPFIQHVDFACYRIDAAPLPAPVTLNLRHLNPVLANFPGHPTTLTGPVQLCVPVAKNSINPPLAVLQLVRFIDLECYRAFGDHPTFTLDLKQLNPQLTAIPPHKMTLVQTPRQVCVPVQKNNQVVPTAILNIVKWVDLEKFAASPSVIIHPVNVLLRHLNPLFTTLAPVPVTLERGSALMVPVAKNGVAPPPP